MRSRALVLALAVAAAAVSPPIDGRAEHNLVWHMAQHLLLLVFTGPLLVLAAGRWARLPSAVPAAAGIAICAVTLWHLPVLFDAARRTHALHFGEHLSFVLASAALWWLAQPGARRPAPVAVLAVFVVSLTGTALGAAMTLATSPWYRAYPDVVQQQVAGALMWSVGGAATTACGLLALVRSLQPAPPTP